MKIDDYGRASFETNELFDLLYVSGNLDDIFVDHSAEMNRFNSLCKINDKGKYALHPLPLLDHSPEEEHKRRRASWMMDDKWREFDVRSYVLSLCKNEAEIQRVLQEMTLFEERDMTMVLRLMVMLVKHFRENNVIFGIGRGSSVASFVLFKIGVHKIDSLRYNLDIGEFLR